LKKSERVGALEQEQGFVVLDHDLDEVQLDECDQD
jgi:hypothetical protein